MEISGSVEITILAPRGPQNHKFRLGICNSLSEGARKVLKSPRNLHLVEFHLKCYVFSEMVTLSTDAQCSET